MDNVHYPHWIITKKSLFTREILEVKSSFTGFTIHKGDTFGRGKNIPKKECVTFDTWITKKISVDGYLLKVDENEDSLAIMADDNLFYLN